MKSTILRYGLLLACFLIVLEVGRHSYLMRSTGVEAYTGLIAILFLALGVWVALRLRRQANNRAMPGINAAEAGDFSEREQDVLLFLSHGYSNVEIADRLGISRNTVKTHLKNIYGKLGVTNRTQAAAEAKILKILE